MTQTNLKQRVKNKHLKESSVRWVRRHLNDPYVKRAKEEGYRSRAAYKLLEIDAEYKILKKGNKVLDLGAAPGGWSQVAVSKVGKGNVFGVDLLDVLPVDGAAFIKADFLSSEAQDFLRASLLGGKADVIISDIAPNTIGHKSTDHLRIMAILEEVYAFTLEHLAEGGTFLAKVFQGGAEKELLAEMKKNFSKVRHVKPKASRSDSVEMYVLATGKK